MIASFLVQNIVKNLIYTPTRQQKVLIEHLSEFIFESQLDPVFLLRGYAGTGKTSVVSALVKTLMQLKQKVVLLAPTGRAAKVLSNYAGIPASTIHRKIFRLSSFDMNTANYQLNDNLHRDTLFIVDEASMISNQNIGNMPFGSGCLLDDLVHFVFSGVNSKLLLIGDVAQLPPIGEELSPALSEGVLEGYGLNASSYELTDVVRQRVESGILYNATVLREKLSEGNIDILPKFKVGHFDDIMAISGAELIEEISNSYDQVGKEDTIVITRSNKRANLYNKGIRNSVFYSEDELSTGDLMMVTRNNYYWAKEYKEIDFLANGEIVKLERISKVYELYGFKFADVTLVLPDYHEYEMDVKILLDTLYTDTPSLDPKDYEKLFYAVMEDYQDLSIKRERIKRIKEDPHFNALQIKFAYAITGHKSQGGQWKHVFLDQGYISEEYLNRDYFRWLYTVFTRASEKLYLVNYPEEQLISD